MEKLLNKLIEKGWKPFGKEAKEIYIDKNEITIERLNGFRVVYTTRQISSIDSGLWQFVCDNHLYIYKMGESKNFIQDHFKNEYNECCYQYLYDKSCYEYYLLESALCKEENLEKFLIDNIKIS